MKKLLFLVLLLSTFFGYAQYTLIPDVNFEKALINDGIDSGLPDGRVLTTNVSGITSFGISDTDLTDLTGIQDFVSLTELQCPRNKLTSLDISKNTSLTLLSCWGNNLTTLDTSKNAGLKFLSCFQNRLKSLDISKNPLMSQLYCSWNELTSLNLKNGNNKNLIALNVWSNANLTCIQVDNKTYSDNSWLASSKDATAIYSEDCSKTTATIAPPVITATGNQTYCPGTSQKIVESISITSDPTEPSTDAIYIQISSGYIFGQDLLKLANPASHPSIITSWDATAGKLKLYSPTAAKVLYSDFVSAIREVEFSNSAASPTGTRNFSITIGQANYLPSTGHYYQFVPNIGITWTAAKTAAESLNYYGLKGYLATILSAEEAQISGEQASGAGWIGGTDQETEGVWKWVTGPEGLSNSGTGIVFWNGLANGSTPNYANWNTGEPNQHNGKDEDYAHITAPGVGLPGSWNDLAVNSNPNGAYQAKGFVVEYGGLLGDPVLQISASTKITIPNIINPQSNSICGSGTVILQASASDNGTVYWFDAPRSGTLLHTGNSFTTPNLTTSRSYYVSTSNGSCPNSTRTEISATVYPIPLILSTTGDSICNSGTAVLKAVASTGTINWYSSPIGGTILGTGTTFTTPQIMITTTYYVEATAATCSSPTRTAVTATVFVSPKIISFSTEFVCNSGSSTLQAYFTKGIIHWYDVPEGGTSLATGNVFTTPILSESTTFYVDAIESGCAATKRTAIPVTVTQSPTITYTKADSRCDAGSLTLEAEATLKNSIKWYDVATAGIPLGSGASFTTPFLTRTKTYYVEAATPSGCTNSIRTPILATINSTPKITSVSPAFRCDSGTVVLSATASSGVINWYDQPIGGMLLGTGETFTTPNITTTTAYYVDSTTNGCISSRQAVEATVYPVVPIKEEVILCQSQIVILDASVEGTKYMWSPNGETTPSIQVSQPGEYSVLISSTLANCDLKKEFKVTEYQKPIIKEILVNKNSISIEVANPETYFEFSIDGEIFQKSNQFYNIPSGQYVAYVRDKNKCDLVDQNFAIYTISKYFTPNQDGINDVWEIFEMRNYPGATASIFNRYGLLLKQLNAANPSWNGNYNGTPVPADDYWYVLKLENGKPEIKGHFSLKR